MSWTAIAGGVSGLHTVTLTTSQTVTLSGAVAVGDVIIVSYNRDASVNAMAGDTVPTDSLGNTYVFPTGSKMTDSTDAEGVAVAYSIVTNAGTPTITTHYAGTGSSFCEALAEAYHETGGAPSLDTGTGAPKFAASAQTTGAGTGNASQGAVTPTASGAAVFGVFGNCSSAGTSYTAGSNGFTIDRQTNNVTGADTAIEHKFLAAASAQTADITDPATGALYLSGVLVFIPAAGGGTKAVTPAGINATSSMSASVQKIGAVKPAAINATSSISVSSGVTRQIAAASITATSTVTVATWQQAIINATSAITATVVKRGSVHPAAITATSPISATLSGGTPATHRHLAPSLALTVALGIAPKVGGRAFS